MSAYRSVTEDFPLRKIAQLDIPGRDHNPAVGDKVFKAGALAFLAERP